MMTSISKLSRINVLFSTVAIFVLSVVANEVRAQNTLDLAGLTSTSQIEVAYSMRRLSSTYTGSLIQVRRSSDNTTSNIGYDASGHLDTSALKTFVGAGNGYVSKWYDQSGNANDAFQSTAGSQPIIVSSGVILRTNSRPVIRFNGTNYMDGGTTTYGITNDRTLNAVYNVASGAPSAVIDRTPASNGMFVINGNNTGFARNDGLSYVTLGNISTAPFTNTFTFTWESDGSLNLYKSSIPEGTGTKALPSNMNIMRIARHVSSTATAEINFWEIVLFSTAVVASERQVLDCGQQNYYNIVPDAIGGTASVCVGANTTLTHSVTGGTWSSSDAGIASIGSSSGTVTGISSGTTTITYTRTTDCVLNNPITKIVTVNTSPSISAGSAVVTCIGCSNSLSATGGTTYTWSPSTGLSSTTGASVTASPTVATTYTVTGTTSGCSGTATVNVSFLPIPTVTNITPKNGYIGSTVSITGTNFNTTPANNLVYFGATRATVSAASSTSLTVTAPTGATYKEISVNDVTTGLTGYAPFPFSPSFDNSAFQSGSVNFDNQVSFTAGSTPQSIAIGDLDGDGKSDVAVLNNGAATLSVYRNTSSSGTISTASFSTQVTFATGTNPIAVAIGDLDGDGKPEIVVANQGGNNLSIYRNTSSSGSITTGSFASQVTFATGTEPRGIAIGDIDGDGKPEIVTANRATNNISVFRNISTSGSITTGSFATHVTFAVGTNPYGVVISDLDGDTKPDIAVANVNSTTMSVLRNTSTTGTIATGSLAGQVTFATGTSPYSVVASDLDGDNKPDLAVVNSGSNTISVYRNTSTSGTITTGSFAAQVTFATGTNPWHISVADIDGDAKPDLAVANNSSGTVSIIRNTSTSGSITSGSFATQVTFATGSNPRGIAIGDLDGDGKPDLAVANGGSTSISVLRNSPIIPRPTVTSVSPNSGNQGATVTITGTNFNTTNTNNIVYFGATKATVTAATSTSLTATVPVGATYKGISVMNRSLSRTGYAASSFVPTYDNSSYETTIVNFDPQVPFTTGSSPQSVVTGDIDGDGKVDMAVANLGSNTISVYRNTSSSGSITAGSFATPVTFNTGTTPYMLAIEDIDGDGKLDLAVTNYGSNSVSLLRNTSTSGSITTGSFADQVTFATGSTPITVTIGDVDGDGKADMAVTNQGSNNVSVYRNISDTGSITTSSFESPVTFATGTGPRNVVFGDIDGDGKSEMVVTNQNSNTTSVYRNTSSIGSITTASFASAVNLATGSNPFGVVVGDIDGDGKSDIAVSNYGANSISVYRNTSSVGTVSLAGQVTFSTGTNPYNLGIGDINGDGKPELIVPNYTSNTVSVFRNTSTSGSITSGSFAAQATFATGTNPQTVSVSDLDGDGKSDVAITNIGSNNVSIIRNYPLNPTTGTATVCTGNTTTLSNATGGGTWTSGNTAVATVGSASGVVTGIAGGTASISYSGAFGYVGKTVTVYTTPTVTVTNTLVCTDGTATVTASGATTYTWSPGTGLSATTGASVTASPTTTTTYTVTGTTTGCSATASVIVAIKTAPTITSVSPLVGYPASAVTITGTNFDTATTDNLVYFGATKASVTSASATSLTVTVPTGATFAPVTVNRSGCNLTALSQFPYLPTYDNSSFAAGTINLNTKVDFTTSTSPYGLAIGDVDGDGKSDVVVGGSGIGYISVLRNTSTSGTISAGSFAAKVDFAAATTTHEIRIADIDGDGKRDIITTNGSSNSVSVFRNTSTPGTISFATRVDFSSFNFATGLVIDDFDGDGKLDMAVANNGVSSISIRRNTSAPGSVSFASSVSFTTGSSPMMLTSGDIDGDGKSDLAVPNYGYLSTTVSILRNTSSAGTISASSFAAKVDITVGATPGTVELADIDGDGKLDMAVSNVPAGLVSVLRNIGTSGSITTGSFATKVDFDVDVNPWGLAFSDINGDAKPDLVVASAGGDRISIFRNTATSGAITASSFAARVNYSTNAAPNFLEVGDLDGDYKPDIVTSNWNSGNLSIFRNNPLTATTGTPTVCVGSTTTLSNATSGGTWSSGSPSIATVGAATGIVTGVAAGTASISYNLSGGRVITIVTVNALPTISAGSGVAICTGNSTNLTATGGNTYSWLPATDLSATTGSGVSASPTVTTTYTVTGTNTLTCSNTATVTVSVATASPTSVTATASSTTLCSGNNLTLTGSATTSAGTLTYAWAGPNSYSASTQNPASFGVSTLSAGVYTITATNACGSTTGVTAAVTVNPTPSVDTISGSNILCSGQTTTLTCTTTGGTWSSSSTATGSISSTGVVTGIAGGSYTISYGVSNSCGTSYVTKSMLGYLTPTIGISVGSNNSCVGATATYTATPTTGYTWTSSNGAVGTINTGGSVLAISAGTTTLSYTHNTAGCRATTVQTVNAIPSFSITTPVCATTTQTLTGTPAGGTWTSSNTSVATIGSASGIFSTLIGGTTNIQYTYGPCSATTAASVSAMPGAITGTTSVCSGSTTQLSSGTASQTWSVANTAIATITTLNTTTSVVTGVSTGTTTVSYTNASNCSRIVTLTVTSPMTANTGTTLYCMGQTATLSNATTGGAWTSGATGVATINSSSGLTTPISTGTSGITYSTTSPSSCQTTTEVTVNAALTANTGTANVCVGQTTTLANSTSGGTWISSNANATVGSATGVVTGVTAGNSTITYYRSDACYKNTALTVNANPASISGTLSACEAAATPTLTCTTASGTWSSSNTLVATIGSSTGAVTPLSAGTTTITYKLTTTGCYSTATFTVNPTPVSFTASSAVCTGTTTTISTTPAGGTWESSTTAVASIGSSSGVLTGNTAGTTKITYTLATGCSRNETITVNASPAAITGTLSACEGSTSTLSNTTSGGTWLSSSTAIATVGSATGTVAGVASGTSTITYKLTSSGCFASATFTVNPAPAAITGTLYTCAGSTTTLANSVTGGTWISSATAIATVGSANGTVTGVADGTSTITYTLSAGCNITATYTVNANPQAITGTINACEGSTSTLANTTSGGTWLSSNAAVATVGSSTGTVTGVAYGTSTITYQLSTTGCYSTTTFTVNQTPSVIGGTLSACAGATTTLTNTVTGGTWTSATTSVATIGSSNGIVTGVASGTSEITYALAAGCYKTAVVTINAVPVISGTVELCDGSSTTLTATPTGGTWTSGSPAVVTVDSLTGEITGVSGGTSRITYTGTNTCRAVVQVSVNASMGGAISGPSGVCNGFTAPMTHATSGGTWTSSDTTKATIDASTGLLTALSVGSTTVTYSLGGTCFRTKWVAIQIQPEPITGNSTICNGSYSVLSSTVGGSGTWSSADTTIANPDLTSGMISGMSVGTTTITYRIPVSGCKVTTTVNVVAGPTAISGTLFVCQGSSVSPTSTPTGGTWAISNEGVATIDSATGVISGVSSGYATVSYTLSTGCRVTAEVTVSNMPAAISGTLALCPAGTTTLSSAPTGGTWSGSTPGVATISSAGVVSPVATGTTTITYTLSSSCARTAIVTVNSVPPAITGEGTVCVGSGTTLSNTSSGGTWMSGNTAKATVGLATGLVSGISTGTAVISYFVSGPGCYTTRVQTISATPAAISGTMNACIGETSTLSHAISGGTWSSGNTSIATVDASGVVTAVSAGYAMITYQTTPGCWVTGSFNSKALPAAITGTPYACVGTTTSLLSITTLGVWTSSNTGVATIQSPSGTVTGISAGTATITYKLTSGCYRTTEVTVSAAPATISGPSALCRTASTTLTCTPTGGTWISSTPAAATINSATGELTGVAAGTTRITYTQAVTGCRSVKTMTIGAPPAAIGGTLSTCAGSATTLTDATTGGTWSSSDVSTANIGSSTGLATAVATGTATVSYTHSGGCVATAILTVTPAVGTSSGDTTLCVGGTTTLTNTAGGGTWVSSTTAKATVGSATGIVKGIATGTATITYKVNPSCFNTRIVTVSATPVAISGPAYVCINTDGSFTHAVSGGTWSSSNPAVGSIDGSTGVFRGITAGAVVITYITGNGCFVTKSVNIANNPPAITGNLAVCASSASALTCVVGGSATWSSSNTAVGTIGSTSGMLAGVAAGTTTVTYRLNTTGCYSTAIATINPLPATITGGNTICVGSTQTYSSTTTGGTWTSSNASAASIGSTSGTATGISAGVITLSYTISTGCRTTKTVTVNSLPAAITGTSSYCVSGSATLASATTGGTWSSDNAAATVAGSGTVTATTAGTSVISYTLATGCARYATVTVNAALPANTGNNSICAGGTTTLANTSGGGTWASSATTKATVGSASGIVTGVATGSANISFIKSGAGCISVTQVTVNAAIATITGTANACVGASSTLAHAISGGTWSSSNTAMATVDASSGVVSGISAGTPVITYTASPGCYKTANFTVKALPSAITGNGSVCTGSATVLSGSPTGGTWASGNTTIATVNTTTGALTGVTAGTVAITYKGANGCYISTTRTVNAAPASITGTFTAAVGGSRTLLNTTPSGAWTSSNSAIASVTSATGVVTGVATGSAIITYTVSNGCFKSVTFTVTAAKEEIVSENETPIFRVYPNPVSGILHLETSEAGAFRLFSYDGKCVLTAQVQLGDNALELPMELSAGSYIGQFTSETGNQHIVRLTVE